MKKRYFIGVDGGGTKSRLQLEDEHGNVLSRKINGPASIRWSVETTWDSIGKAFQAACAEAQLDVNDPNIEFYAGMGLAGNEIPEARNAFLSTPHPFKELLINSDGYTACLGAHENQDGSIITVGTGVVGFLIENQQAARVGGWGFPHDDKGGGAWLGVEATRMTVQWLDGRINSSPLLMAIYKQFNNDSAALSTWANNADAKQFASLAPIVIEHIDLKDALALSLIKQAAAQVDLLYQGLLSHQKSKLTLPCCLFGGIAPFVQPWLNEQLKSCITERKQDPAQGAIIMIRNAILGNHAPLNHTDFHQATQNTKTSSKAESKQRHPK